MARLGDTVAALTRAHRGIATARLAFPQGQDGTLHEVAQFGANPGALRMLRYRPENLPADAPLVVVLHGCGQTAAGYDTGAGWSTLAERFGFALVFPEQRRANNAGTCFNWFDPQDTTRNLGEAASVASIVAYEIGGGGIDPGRVFVTGLSAGGAFANALLALYPEIFAAGAIIAGLPFGAATNLNEALDAMRRGTNRSQAAWGDLVRAASPRRTTYPRVAIWHGTADHTVAPANATDLASQWCAVHGLTQSEITQSGRLHRQIWRGPDGKPAIERVTIDLLGHGTPISAVDADPVQRCGMPGAFIFETGISSSYVIATSWGLTDTIRRHTAAQPNLVQRVLGLVQASKFK